MKNPFRTGFILGAVCVLLIQIAIGSITRNDGTRSVSAVTRSVIAVPTEEKSTGQDPFRARVSDWNEESDELSIQTTELFLPVERREKQDRNNDGKYNCIDEALNLYDILLDYHYKPRIHYGATHLKPDTGASHLWIEMTGVGFSSSKYPYHHSDITSRVRDIRNNTIDWGEISRQGTTR